METQQQNLEYVATKIKALLEKSNESIKRIERFQLDQKIKADDSLFRKTRSMSQESIIIQDSLSPTQSQSQSQGFIQPESTDSEYQISFDQLNSIFEETGSQDGVKPIFLTLVSNMLLSAKTLKFVSDFNESVSYSQDAKEIISGLEKRLKILTRKNDELTKKSAVGENGKIASNKKSDNEIHKLRLKIISLEKQNEFLIQKNKALEIEKTTSTKKKVIKKKKKVLKKDTVYSDGTLLDQEAEEEDDDEPVQLKKVIKNKKSVLEEVVEADEEIHFNKETPKEKIISGVINIPSGQADKPQKKKFLKAKKAESSNLPLILLNINQIFIDALLNDGNLTSNEKNSEDRASSLYQDDNYTEVIKHILELAPTIKLKNFRLLSMYKEFFSKIFNVFYLLITSKSKVHFPQNQNDVETPSIFPLNYQTSNPYWSRFLTSKDMGKKAISDSMMNRIAIKPFNYKLLIQRDVQGEFCAIIGQIANFSKTSLYKLRSQLFNIKDYHFENFPKANEIRGNMCKLMDNLEDRLTYSKLYILCEKIVQAIMPKRKDEFINFVQNEIDDIMDAKNWGQLINEFYNPNNTFSDQYPVTDYTSEAQDMFSSASENSKYEYDENYSDIDQWRNQQKNKVKEKSLYMLNTQFGGEYNEKLKQWYQNLLNEREELLLTKDLEKKINVDQIRPDNLKDVEYLTDGLFDGWTLHADGVQLDLPLLEENEENDEESKAKELGLAESTQDEDIKEIS